MVIPVEQEGFGNSARFWGSDLAIRAEQGDGGFGRVTAARIWQSEPSKGDGFGSSDSDLAIRAEQKGHERLEQGNGQIRSKYYMS
ncbi:hypothetical protein QUF72_18805 [Desulfobacterales bacterium HSG2]|nr:hypothetical protein [Desulfobacterales bacterium HSG2]